MNQESTTTTVTQLSESIGIYAICHLYGDSCANQRTNPADRHGAVQCRWRGGGWSGNAERRHGGILDQHACGWCPYGRRRSIRRTQAALREAAARIGQRVGAVATSTTTLSVAPATVMYGDTATLTAVVSPSFATGTVSFYEGSTLLGTASLDSTATAVLPISTLNAGVHTIVAKYNGDPGVPANTSNTVQLTVTQRTAPGGGPAITVTVNDASRTTTQSNPPFSYSPAGQLVNGDTFATAISGTASYATAAGTTAGTYSITVSGLTSANYTIAFVPGTLTVTAASTTITLVAGPTSTQYGDPVTLTATVTSGATGTVSFYDGTVLLGTGTVSNGVATLTTSTLIAGTHTITAVYNGDATYASSQSGPATVTVAKKQGAGGGAALTITVQNESRQYNTADPQFRLYRKRHAGQWR